MKITDCELRLCSQNLSERESSRTLCPKSSQNIRTITQLFPLSILLVCMLICTKIDAHKMHDTVHIIICRRMYEWRFFLIFNRFKKIFCLENLFLQIMLVLPIFFHSSYNIHTIIHAYSFVCDVRVVYRCVVKCQIDSKRPASGVTFSWFLFKLVVKTSQSANHCSILHTGNKHTYACMHACIYCTRYSIIKQQWKV